MPPWSSFIPSDALWAWQLEARCRDEDPDLFFSSDGERKTSVLRRQQKAKQICAKCAVVKECLQHSIRHGESFGIWGGLAPDERDRLKFESRHVSQPVDRR